MQVEFSLIPQDIAAWTEDRLWKKLKPWMLLFVVILTMFLIPQIVILPQAPIFFPLVAFEGFLWVVVIFYLTRSRQIALRSAERLLRKGNNAKLLELRKVGISPEGLSYSSANWAGVIKWTAVDKITVTKDHAFFYLSTYSAHVVPRRAFSSEQEFADFVQTAQRYFEATNKELQPA